MFNKKYKRRAMGNGLLFVEKCSKINNGFLVVILQKI
jgi:hypothetical protein